MNENLNNCIPEATKLLQLKGSLSTFSPFSPIDYVYLLIWVNQGERKGSNSKGENETETNMIEYSLHVSHHNNFK